VVSFNLNLVDEPLEFRGVDSFLAWVLGLPLSLAYPIILLATIEIIESSSLFRLQSPFA